MGTCLECEEHIEIDENVEVGDVIECPDARRGWRCWTSIPVSFDYAPDPKATRGWTGRRLLLRRRPRSFRHEDAPELVRLADNPKVWLQLSGAFPHPYRPEDARRFLDAHVGAVPETVLAIEAADGGFAGASA